MVWTDSMVSDYSKWLHAEPAPICDSKTGWTSMPTPFLGLYNDLIELFVKEEDDYICLSDDGQTIWNAETTGLDMKAPEQKHLLDVILSKYRVSINGEGVLDLKVEKDKFEQGKYSMLMTMFAINDMTSQGNNIFQKNVRKLMMDKMINAVPQMQIKGRSGIDFTFDYVVSRPSTEFLVQAVGNLDKNNLASFILGVDEVKDYRRFVSDKDIRGMLIVNDLEKAVNKELLQALIDRKLDYVLWSKKEEYPAWEEICSV
jgi:hypothetical protein